MPQLSGRQATVYAVLVFLLTICLSYFLPGNTITLSGLLVVIFLSVFVQTRSATIIAAVSQLCVIVLFIVWNQWQLQLTQVWAEYFFSLILILFTTLIVLYIKSLVRSMQWDKSHMTSLFENATEGIVLDQPECRNCFGKPCRLPHVWI